MSRLSALVLSRNRIFLRSRSRGQLEDDTTGVVLLSITQLPAYSLSADVPTARYFAIGLVTTEPSATVLFAAASPAEVPFHNGIVNSLSLEETLLMGSAAIQVRINRSVLLSTSKCMLLQRWSCLM